jgi:hypothetical protein
MPSDSGVTIIIHRPDDSRFSSDIFTNVSLRDLHAVYVALSDMEPINVPAVKDVAVYSDAGACLCTSLSQDVRNNGGNCLWCGHAEHYSRAFCGALR